MLYYHPSVPQAYADMKDLQFVVSSGLFLRNLHRWSAQLMVFLVLSRTCSRSFIVARIVTPREFNWVVGIVLLLITLLLSYTGYLLPWDQLAYWAITVGSNLSSAVPLVGSKIHFLLLGGHQSAVHKMHLLRLLCSALRRPAAWPRRILFIAVHFWRIHPKMAAYTCAMVRAEARKRLANTVNAAKEAR